MLPAKAIVLLAAASLLPQLAAAQGVTWKPLDRVLLKMDERPAPGWDVYRAHRRDHLVLVRLGERYLLLDLKQRAATECDPAAFRAREKELTSDAVEKLTAEAPEAPSGSGETQDAGGPVRRHVWPKRLESADWVVRDAGTALLVRVRLAAEGRVLELNLPQQPDLRWLY